MRVSYKISSKALHSGNAYSFSWLSNQFYEYDGFENVGHVLNDPLMIYILIVPRSLIVEQ